MRITHFVVYLSMKMRVLTLDRGQLLILSDSLVAFSNANIGNIICSDGNGDFWTDSFSGPTIKGEDFIAMEDTRTAVSYYSLTYPSSTLSLGEFAHVTQDAP